MPRVRYVPLLLFAWLTPGLAAAQLLERAPGTAPRVGAVARGTFEVRLTPLPAVDSAGNPALGRLAIAKQFHGDLEGLSAGEMLTAMSPVQGSAGYVAVERVRGTLRGRSGTFLLQHSGTVTRGSPELSITVVPDSGTGQLLGLTGRMRITVVEGRHSYELEYTLPGVP